MNKGLLYLCATPIGNLEDMTFRAIRTLKEVDLIAAEDTRHTLKLINHFEIKTPMTAYHEHNKVTKGPKLIEEILAGKNMALVTDAGLPGISDPGYDLVCLAVEGGIKVIPLPGATASLSALIISGLPTERFAFEGFLGHKSKERKPRLDKLLYDDRTLIFYEAPHRLEDTLKDILAVLGDRETALVRELTKKHETVLRGKVSELMEILKNESPRGEYVIVLEGSKEVMVQEKPWESLSIDEHLQLFISQGVDKKEAVKVVAKERGLPKREVYEVSINL
jgi:16S rRNA (cytidine1402-2'-O)-methyltransferase